MDEDNKNAASSKCKLRSDTGMKASSRSGSRSDEDVDLGGVEEELHSLNVLDEYHIVVPDDGQGVTTLIRDHTSCDTVKYKDGEQQKDNPMDSDVGAMLTSDGSIIRSRSRFIGQPPAELEDGEKERTAHPDDESQTDSQICSEIDRSPPVLCPPVNCPEKIIICLDLHKEVDSTTFNSRAGDKYSGLELAKRAIRMFVLHKSQMSSKHEFSFLIFHEESTMIHCSTNRIQDILDALDEGATATQLSGALNLAHMFETIKESVQCPVVSENPQVIPPPYIVRVLLIFGRSHSVPVGANSEAQRELESSPYFFTDVLYIHEPPSADNKCEEIFSVLCDLDHNGMSYIFEQSKYTPILNSGAKLLAHPLQRPQQLQASYKMGKGVATSQPRLIEERVH